MVNWSVFKLTYYSVYAIKLMESQKEKNGNKDWYQI